MNKNIKLYNFLSPIFFGTLQLKVKIKIKLNAKIKDIATSEQNADR